MYSMCFNSMSGLLGSGVFSARSCLSAHRARRRPPQKPCRGGWSLGRQIPWKGGGRWRVRLNRWRLPIHGCTPKIIHLSIELDGFLMDFRFSKPSIFWYLHFKKPELITKSWSPNRTDTRWWQIWCLVGGLYGWTKRKTRKNRCSRATLATGRAFLASSRFQAAGTQS